jgi:hypothetical protein
MAPKIFDAISPENIAAVRALFVEYANWRSRSPSLFIASTIIQQQTPKSRKKSTRNSFLQEAAESAELMAPDGAFSKSRVVVPV